MSRVQGHRSRGGRGSAQYDNPFIIDPVEQARRKRELVEKSRTGKVHEKTTAAYREGISRRAFLELDDDTDDDTPEDDAAVSTTKPRNSSENPPKERELLSQLIERKRETFLKEYSIAVQREEIQKIEEAMAERKKDLISAETRQQMEASMFEQQLNDISTKTIDTLERVKAETKINLEKEEAIQNATATIASLSEEISHIDISLEEVRKYKQFLDAAASFEETCALKGTASKEPTRIEVWEDPTRLLRLFSQLEKQNILLLAQKEESDQLLDHATVKKKYLATKTDHEQMELQRQIEEIQQAVDIERVNEAQLLEREIQQNDASNVHDHVEEVIQLEEKISEIFQDLTVETSTTKPLSSIEMITEIEICADKLLAQLNALPADYVQKALKDKVKDRRRRQRDSKREIEKTHAEELRSKVSSDHTTLKSTRKRDGKPAMFRSTLSLKASSVTAKHHTKEEEEDLLYFGLAPLTDTTTQRL